MLIGLFSVVLWELDFLTDLALTREVYMQWFVPLFSQLLAICIPDDDTDYILAKAMR